MSTQPPPENPWPRGQPPPPPGYWQPPPGSPPPWQPPPKIDESLLRPRKLWYFVAAAIFAACMIAAIWLGYLAVRHAFDPLTRFSAPGSVEVRLDAGEGRSIYEQIDGRSEDPPGADLRCVVRGMASGSRPGLSEPLGRFQLDRNARAYIARLDFEAPVSDRYRVACKGPARSVGEMPLAIGPKAHVGRFVARIFGAIGLFFASFVLGAAIAVPTLLMRNKHRRALEQAAAPDG